ncbi:MAG: enoyl-CoA hydratase-related protein, partial [Saprospiraceae bacterium]|nr:enoyl-CoA hydratase-related protein [Saprospiraceae bacterium]
MTQFDNLLVEVVGGIATIVINRPDKLNALNFATLKELDQALTDLEVKKEVSGVIITGQGDKAFVAGADISEFRTLSKENAVKVAQD